MISRGRPWSPTRRRNVTEPLAAAVRLPSRNARETVRGVMPGQVRRAPLADHVIRRPAPVIASRPRR